MAVVPDKCTRCRVRRRASTVRVRSCSILLHSASRVRCEMNMVCRSGLVRPLPFHSMLCEAQPVYDGFASGYAHRTIISRVHPWMSLCECEKLRCRNSLHRCTVAQNLRVDSRRCCVKLPCTQRRVSSSVQTSMCAWWG